MKVKELKELLAVVDPETEIILLRDAEGNGYSPLFSAESGRWVALSKWYGEPTQNKEEGVSALFLQPSN